MDPPEKLRPWAWRRIGLCVFTVITGIESARAGETKVTIDRVEYKGWKNNLRIQNDQAEVIVTLDVGPRVISYRLKDGKNVFKEFPDQLGKSGETEWMIRGGHRLWTSPEDLTRTYALDNGPVQVEELPDGAVRVKTPPDMQNGIAKEIDLRLADMGSAVTLTHRIRNIGSQPTELAPWALTVMDPGGVVIIPLPPKKPHPGHPKNVTDPADFLPTFEMVAWAYTDFADPRFTLGSKYILLRYDKKPATKIGLAHRQGWVGYWNAGSLFIKRFSYEDGKNYPDRGCNFETFTNEDILEIETLGPTVRLNPGEATELVEYWSLTGGVPEFKTEAEIDERVLSRAR